MTLNLNTMESSNFSDAGAPQSEILPMRTAADEKQEAVSGNAGTASNLSHFSSNVSRVSVSRSECCTPRETQKILAKLASVLRDGREERREELEEEGGGGTVSVEEGKGDVVQGAMETGVTGITAPLFTGVKLEVLRNGPRGSLEMEMEQFI